MLFPLLLAIGGLLCGWTFLSVLGNERQRQVQNREIEQRNAAITAANAAAADARVKAGSEVYVAR
jgi:hypothetical protein